jgi:hypothetical protein
MKKWSYIDRSLNVKDWDLPANRIQLIIDDLANLECGRRLGIGH